MTRSDILNAVRDGACSQAFGEKCMVQQQVGVDLAACAKQLEKERDDARREVDDLRRRFSEASQMAQECADALAESQAREVQTRALLLKLYGTPSMQLLESGHVWIREALATKPNTDALKEFGLKVIAEVLGYESVPDLGKMLEARDNRVVDAVLARGSR